MSLISPINYVPILDHGHPLSKGLYGYWLCNEGAGNIIYDISSGKNGYFRVSPTWGIGNLGKTPIFNGTTQCLAAPIAPTNILPCTQSAWVKLDSVPSADNWKVILSAAASANGNYTTILCVWAGNVIRAITQGAGAQTLNVTTWNLTCDTDWHHITFIYNSGLTPHIFYHNGVYFGDAAASGSGGSLSDVDMFFVGGSIYDTTSLYGPINGRISNVRFYKRGISSGEARALYLNPFAGILRPKSPLIFLPVGGISVKSFSGLAQASIKTYQGLASASVKTINSLSNV